jgi:protein-S-isoprenylcysteine O-methyltransferase Ste14
MVNALGQIRRIQLHLPLALLALLLARPQHLTNILGTALVLLGLTVRMWAAGVLLKGGGLCTDGPYGLVRHPLYLGSILAALGFAVMMHTIWAWLVVMPVFVALYAWQVSLEERQLRMQYGEAHQAWARQVPLLFPCPCRRGAAEGGRWELARVRANREHYHLLVTVALVVAFYLKPLWATVER